jgi:hypothetical protein
MWRLDRRELAGRGGRGCLEYAQVRSVTQAFSDVVPNVGAAGARKPL